MRQEASIQEVENGFIVRTYRGNDSPMTISDNREKVKVFSNWLEVFTELGVFFSAGAKVRGIKACEDESAKCSGPSDGPMAPRSIRGTW